MLTRVVSGLYGGRRAGSFAGKTTSASTHPVGILTRVESGIYGGRRAGSFAGRGAAPVVVDLTLAGLAFAPGSPQASTRSPLSVAGLAFTAQDIGQRLLATMSAASLTLTAWQIVLTGALDLRVRWKAIQSVIRSVVSTGNEDDAERHRK